MRPVHLWSHSVFPLLMMLSLPQYWAVHGLGLTADDERGSMVPLDLLHTWFVLPFRCFLQRLRTMAEQIGALVRSMKQGRRVNIGYGLLTLGIALVFLMIAVTLLSAADAGFARMMEGLLSGVIITGFDGILLRLMLSIPVGAYLYSLIACGGELDSGWVRGRKNSACQVLEKARKLPAGCWYAVLCGFAALYLLFLVMHVKELIPVLSSRLAPGDMTMADWAVRGFFELCQLMGLNLALLLTAHSTAARPVATSGTGKVLMSIILCESLAFAASAAVKLYLYVAAFGFTPLRLQGAWAIL